VEYYPAFLDIEGKLVVVIGGGKVAFRKVKSLREAGARCRVVSPVLHEGLVEFRDNGDIEYINDVFKEEYLDGAWLVVAATNDPETQDRVFDAAQRNRIFCNVVDVPSRCSFIVPSVVKRGALKIAISTSGLGPGLSKNIRKELEKQFPESISQYIECVGKIRRLIINNLKNDDEKKRALKILFDLKSAQCFIDGDKQGIRQWAKKIGGEEALKIVRNYYG